MKVLEESQEGESEKIEWWKKRDLEEKKGKEQVMRLSIEIVDSKRMFERDKILKQDMKRIKDQHRKIGDKRSKNQHTSYVYIHRD